MRKLIVLTRGRTGSTAIIDSLAKSKTVATLPNEPFIKMAVSEEEKIHLENKKNPKLITCRYDYWLLEKKKHFGFIHKIYSWIHERLNKKATIQEYLCEMQMAVQSIPMTRAFCFKVLSHHLLQRPVLKDILLEQNYKIVYLTRNIPRQVISGMVAKLRGKYNAHNRENYSDDTSYKIDLDELKSNVVSATRGVSNDLAMLESSGFEFIQVRYEDFVENPDIFFSNIFSFLDIPEEKLPESSFSIMIKDLKQAVQNYQEVENCLAEMGMTIE